MKAKVRLLITFLNQRTSSSDTRVEITQGILSFAVMDANYANRNSDPDYLASTGNALNMAANELADVLHTFFLNVVDEN